MLWKNVNTEKEVQQVLTLLSFGVAFLIIYNTMLSIRVNKMELEEKQLQKQINK